MSGKTIKISQEEALKKIERQIKKGAKLGEEGLDDIKKFQDNISYANDQFESKYKIWLEITSEILNDIFVSSLYVNDFKEKESSHKEYVRYDWKPDIKYWVTKQLVPKINYLKILKENITEFEYIEEKQNNTIDYVPESDDQTREKIFPKGFNYDAAKALGDIIKSAKSKIYLIDNYVDENILDFFTQKNSGVELSIITQDIPDAMKHMAKQFSRQHGKLEIRKSKDYHDRFLIIDENIFYHFGASLKDLGNKTFMFSKIEEAQNKKTLIEKWKNDWSASDKII